MFCVVWMSLEFWSVPIPWEQAVVLARPFDCGVGWCCCFLWCVEWRVRSVRVCVSLDESPGECACVWL